MSTNELGYIDNANEQLTLWIEESKDFLLKAKKQRILTYQKMKGEIIELKQKRKQLELEAENTKLTEEQQYEINSLTNEIKKLNLATEEKLQLKDEQKENLKKNENINKLKSDDIFVKERVVDKKLEKLDKGITFFEENLGLKVKRFPDSHLKFIFTNFCESKPDKEFSFDLNVEGTPGIYTVKNCSKIIEELEIHTRELNDTNNLKRFLCKMRNGFKRSLQS